MTTYPCPYCNTAASLAGGCPGCGRGPDHDAAEVVRLDGEIGVLNARLAAARLSVETAEAQLRWTWQSRHAAAARVRAKVAAAARGARTPVGGLPGGAAVPDRPAAAALVGSREVEASTRVVQNALFLLGGLLLATAAIVFTAVAWSQFGVGGRAALLAAFTGAALAVPPLALRRALTGTAETFAAVGLLLVVLDGYAAWYVNVFGVADYPAYGYAGAVCAVTAAVAAGYEHLTGLTGPRFAALVVAQPVLPLLAAPLHPGAAGWSFTFAAVAALDLAIVHLRRSPLERRTSPGPEWALRPLGIAAYALGGCFILAAGCAALIGLLDASTAAVAAPAGAALVTAALMVLAAAVLARVGALQSIAGGALVLALGIAGGRIVALFPHRAAPVLVAAVMTVLAIAVASVAGPAPFVTGWRVNARPVGRGSAGRAAGRSGALRWRAKARTVGRGPWAAALVLIAVPGLAALAEVAAAAGESLDAAQPLSGAGLGTQVGGADWRLPAILALLSAGLIALLPASWRRDAAVGGAASLALAAPAGFDLPWWTAPALDLLVVAFALAFAVRATVAGSLAWLAAVVAVLGAHAVSVAFGQPGIAAATLAAVVLLGLAAAVAAWPGPRRRDVGGVSLVTGLLAVAVTAWTLAAAFSPTEVAHSRAALVAAALLVAVLRPIARRWPDYLSFALLAVLLAAVLAPVGALASGDSFAVYVGIGLVLVAATLPAGRAWVLPAAVPLGVALLAAVGSSLLIVLVAPYAWLGRVWSGRPLGVGIDPVGLGRVTAADVIALALLATAVAAGSLLLRDRRAAIWATAPVLAVTIPASLAAAGLRWPGVPAVLLLVGLTGLLAVALRPPFVHSAGGEAAVVGGEVAVVQAISGPAAGAGAAAARAVGTPTDGGVVPARAARAPMAGVAGLGDAGAVGLVVVSVLAALAGLAAALPTRASTLAALAAVLVAAVVAGVAARDLPARRAAWLSAVGAALAVAFTAGRAFELALHTAALPVLATAAGALAAGAWLTGRRPAEARVVQAAAHAGAVVALLLTVGEIRYSAAVCTFWGLAIGARALRRGESPVTRRMLVVVAACAELGGWWLLIAAERVATLEAYTLPAAAVALLAGWLARRTRNGLNSWTAYGPALAAALLPTLASVLAGEGQPMRRLLLGLAALVVVLLGAHSRLRAPVVAGGAVLVVVALHELVLVWDLLPRWIPLASGGLLLVLLAMTLERRRRDLARVRAALTKMS